MKVEVDIKSFLKAINEFHIAEQQPCGVQVVEWVGLVAFSFQFFTRLAAVFAEEVCDFGITNGPIQRCSVFIIIWMPIGA
jgi:hypothetical protein|tara:strand:+ start:578 stop:817 length:240 start_codon:yes stop_codon:yes gene_type:complete